MDVFLKKQKVALILQLVLFVVMTMTCKPPDPPGEEIQSLDSQYLIVKDTNVNKDDTADVKIAYVKDKALIFFRLSPKEYRTLLSQSGDVASFDIKLLFKRFDKTAQEFGRSLRKYDIDSDLLYERKIICITDTGEYIFNRDKEDMIMGHIFFDGEDSVLIEEGFIGYLELQTMVTDFFQTDSINVNANNLILPVDTMDFQDTAQVKQAGDSLRAEPDTVSSGT